MKLRALYATVALFCLLGSLAAAADDKQLQNVHGTVRYQTATGAPKNLAPNATIALVDKDYTITGASSLAAVGLPDSSRVLVDSDSKVQLGFFSRAEGTNATFLVMNGKVRFIV